jgi:hypothetical protein
MCRAIHSSHRAILIPLALYSTGCFPRCPRKRHPPLPLKSTYDLCKNHDFESATLSYSASYIAKPQGLLNRQRERIGEDFGNGSKWIEQSQSSFRALIQHVQNPVFTLYVSLLLFFLYTSTTSCTICCVSLSDLGPY